jgi:hypothetical protein
MKSSIYLGDVSNVLFDPALNGKHLMIGLKLKKPIRINDEKTEMAVVVLNMQQIKEMAQSLVELDKINRKMILIP